MILHLIRHPPPIVEPGICYGRLDLSAKNEMAVAEELQTLLPSGLPVWSSPLRRCRRLAELLDPEAVIDERLMEMNFGTWEGQPWAEIPRQQIDAWAADVAGYAPPGGESPRAVQQRALAFVATLSVPEAVIVTHAGVIRTLVAHWQGLPPERWSALVFDYGSCTRLRVPR